MTSPQNNNIFVPGAMRFAVMNQRTKGNINATNGLTAQQQKIFDMNNSLHGAHGM